MDADIIGIGLKIGLLALRNDGKWGLADTAGKVIVEPTYDELTQFLPSLRGVAWAKLGGRWCAIDRRGRTVPGIACTEADPLGLAEIMFPCKVEW